MRVLIILVALVFTAACGGGGGGSTINENFPDLSTSAITPSTDLVADDTEQVVLVPAGENEQNGMLGTIEKQSAATVLCVIIDPAAGDDADLEVCSAKKANDSASSINGICPKADADTRCASFNTGSGPDFCSVTGTTDYVLVVLNLTAEDAVVAYQVIDVTDQPGQSCADLAITEDSITADDN